MLSPFNVKEDEFIEKALKYDCKEALYFLRMTLVVTTHKRLRKAPEYAGIPFLRVNTLDIIQQRKFAALICFKECSDLLTL